MLCATVLGGEAGAKGTRSLWYGVLPTSRSISIEAKSVAGQPSEADLLSLVLDKGIN